MRRNFYSSPSNYGINILVYFYDIIYPVIAIKVNILQK